MVQKQSQEGTKTKADDSGVNGRTCRKEGAKLQTWRQLAEQRRAEQTQTGQQERNGGRLCSGVGLVVYSRGKQ